MFFLFLPKDLRGRLLSFAIEGTHAGKSEGKCPKLIYKMAQVVKVIWKGHTIHLKDKTRELKFAGSSGNMSQ